MGKTIFYSWVLTLSLIVSSCIYDPDSPGCAGSCVVQLSVKDKNYANLSQFPSIVPVDETLPFRSYVGTLYYTLQSAATGVIEQQSSVMHVAHQAPSHSFTLDEVPVGTYLLTVWGNLTPDTPAGTLHPRTSEHTDMYLASCLLNLTASSQTLSLELERTKGELVLFCTHFPTNITRLQLNVSSVYRLINGYGGYSGQTAVSKPAAVAPMVTTFIAPSIGEEASKLLLNLYKDTDTEPHLTLPEIPLTLRKNQITGVMIDYNWQAGLWQVWTLIEGVWVKVHSLEIE